MSERQNLPYDNVARKWLALVERRYASFLELADTGRWKHYYSQPQFEQEMRKAAELCEQWAFNAGLTWREYRQAAE
jgi:hypothetical protein